MKNTTLIGNIGESIAIDYLKDKGYRILERNAKICGSEIDVICELYFDSNGKQIYLKNSSSKLFKFNFSERKIKEARRTIVFCEVKTRYDNEFGSGAEAVTPYKAGRYVTAAKAYTATMKNVNCDVRFDIIEVGDNGINHIVGAFDVNDAKYHKNYN